MLSYFWVPEKQLNGLWLVGASSRIWPLSTIFSLRNTIIGAGNISTPLSKQRQECCKPCKLRSKRRGRGLMVWWNIGNSMVQLPQWFDDTFNFGTPLDAVANETRFASR